MNDNVPEFCNDLSPRHYYFQNGKDFAKMMYFVEVVAYAPAIYRTKDFLTTELEYEKYSKFNDWPFMVKIAQKGKSILFDDCRIFLVRRHSRQDTWASTNTPSVKQIINWDVCFENAIKPILFTSDWCCFFYKCEIFYNAKYNSFILPEKRNKALYNEMISYAKSQKVSSIYWKICRVFLINKIVNVILPRKQKELLAQFLIVE